MSDQQFQEGAALAEQVALEFVNLLEQARLKVHHCVRQLRTGELWYRPAPQLNSVGNLILHVCGNLQQWVVDGVLQRPNERDRDAEFAATDGGDGTQLLQQLDSTVSAAAETIREIDVAAWRQPRVIQGFQVTVLGAVAHAVPHFVGHTHQIIQLTRLQLGERYRLHWDPDQDRSVVPI
jgi:hypothetical protein